MTVELTYLFWTAILAFVQVAIAATGTVLNNGLIEAANNRENFNRNPPGWAGRACRAHANMLENLVLFAILVIIAHLAQRNNEMTALGAQLFFWGRVAFAAVYIIGIPWLRTVVWGVSIVGLAMIALQLT